MRHNLSFKEFLAISEAGILPPEMANMNRKLGTAIRSAASKNNIPDSRKLIDKTVLKVASQNPMAADALADRMSKKNGVR